METRQRSTGSSTRQYTNTWNSYSFRRLLTAVSYTAFFWIAIPAGIVYTSVLLGRAVPLRILHSQLWVVTGILIFVPSVALLAVSVFQFMERTGELPISALRPRRLVQCGVYASWRHPIYLFYTLSMFGMALLLRSAAMALVVFPGFTLCVAVYLAVEERGLKRRFGEEYIGYCRRTSLVLPRLPALGRLPLLFVLKVLLGFTVHGKEKLPANPPFFLVAAHRSYLDPFFAAMATPFPVRFVTTFEAFRNRFTRFAVTRLLSVPRKRFMPDMKSLRAISAALRDGYAVGIFPEGERSWTGAPGPFKPEVIKLLAHFSEVPVVPVRIEGSYAVWPRWRKGIRPGKVSVTILDPLVFGESREYPTIEMSLQSCVAPSNFATLRKSGLDARGLEKVVYRCPACRAFDALTPAGRDRLICHFCGNGLRLESDLMVSTNSGGGSVRYSIPELYRRIRVNSSDVVPNDYGSVRHFAGEVPGEGSTIAVSGSCRHSSGNENALSMVGNTTIRLTDANLVSEGPGQRIRRPLADITSVTIESNNKLQIYQGHTGLLEEFRFERESALKWQDMIAKAVEIHGSRIVNLT